VEGAQAPSQGAWGMCPQNFERGGELPPLANPPRVGPKTLANPQPTGVGKWGRSRGAKPPWRGAVGGVPPRNQKKGRVATINNPATSGTQNAGKPSAHEGGQRGWRGRSPLPGGMGYVPPKTKGRQVAHIKAKLQLHGVEGKPPPSATLIEYYLLAKV
jgi:hypothetical protein